MASVRGGEPVRSQALPSGIMAAKVDQFDWSSTPLGPRADWPAELQTFVRHILESGFPAAIVWGKGLVTIYNDAFRPILGDKPEALGRSFADVWAEAWEEIGPIADRAFAGQSTYIEDFPLVINRTSESEQAWFTFCYSPLRLGDQTVAGFMDTVVETTATVRSRTDLTLVNQELAHRLKNTLALVQSIAMQTLKNVEPQNAVGTFRDRIQALGKAHDVLLSEGWSSVPLSEVATQTLAPLDGLSQIAIKGPSMNVGSRATLTLSLVLHELATNAAKYGALSVPDGCIDLSWTVDDRNLNLCWSERDGPHVQTPTHNGFGSRLIERGFGTNSQVSRRFLNTGLEVELLVPIQELLD
jgi:two-component sensor histidine kinase